MIKTLTLGYAGEYGARAMTIDLSEEAAMWPDAAAQLLLVRPGEHTPYPADNAVYADGCMTFTPTKADMAIAGQGHAQVYFYSSDGNVLGKSGVMITHILASLGGDSTEPPSDDELGYYDKLMQQAALAIAAGNSAKTSAQSAAENAAKAEAALEEMKSISTQSGNMPDGGSSGQILAKKSDESYDTHWIDPPSGSSSGGGVADSVAWGNVTGKPDTYPPASHTHPEYLGKNETAANANQLNGKSASEYALANDVKNLIPGVKFYYFEIPSGNAQTYIQEIWEDLEGGTFIASVLETEYYSRALVHGNKVSNLYGAYINISYYVQPMYYHLADGVWSETPLV